MSIYSFNSVEEAKEKLQQAREKFNMLQETLNNVNVKYGPNSKEFQKVQQEYIEVEESYNDMKKLVDEYIKKNRTNNSKVSDGIDTLLGYTKVPGNEQRKTNSDSRGSQQGSPNSDSRESKQGNPNSDSRESKQGNPNSTSTVDDSTNKIGVIETIKDMAMEILTLKNTRNQPNNSNKVGLVTKIAQLFNIDKNSNEFKILIISIGILLFSMAYYIFKPIFDVVLGTVKMIAEMLLKSISLGVNIVGIFGPYIVGIVLLVLFVIGTIKVYQYANIFMQLLDDKLNKKIDEMKFDNGRKGKSSNTKTRDTKSSNNTKQQSSSTPRRMIFDDNEDIFISKKETKEKIVEENIIEISSCDVKEEIIEENTIETTQGDIKEEIIGENTIETTQDDIKEEIVEDDNETEEKEVEETNL